MVVSGDGGYGDGGAAMVVTVMVVRRKIGFSPEMKEDGFSPEKGSSEKVVGWPK